MMRCRSFPFLLLILSSCLPLLALAADFDPAPERAKAQTAMRNGNWRDAYQLYEKLVLYPKNDRNQVTNDLHQAVNCLRRLNRVTEIDSLRERTIKVHSGSWQLLQGAATSYLGENHHWGFMVGGEFKRGPKRGGGKVVNALERDRVRAMQLMQQALPLVEEEPNNNQRAQFYQQFANSLFYNRGYHEAWRLQYLTDLSAMPDYDEGYGNYGRQSSGAPVDDKGNPVFHKLPKEFASATTDGERWRWLLLMAMETSATMRARVLYQQASFLRNQFGVQTMRSYGYGRMGGGGDNKDRESGIFALHTLGEDETIAKLASGVKRFKLPADYNFIRLFEQVADLRQSQAEQSLNMLAQLFTDRRQYAKAADYWRRSIKEFGDRSNHKPKQRALDQIVKNWGKFEPGPSSAPAGRGATLDYRFRNGGRVTFEAHAVNIRKLLDDVKAYLKPKRGRLDYQKYNIGNIGYRLVTRNETQYLAGKVAGWSLDLEPRDNHFDKRITVTTPLQKAGAYLLTARMAGGNISRVVIWVDDTAIVKKQLDKEAMYYVADAVSGKPVAGAEMEFFGFWQKHIRSRQYEILSAEFEKQTDDDGMVRIGTADVAGDRRNYSWLVTATTRDGRLAYQGFERVWYGRYRDQQYNQRKLFFITDRPVYRPEQTVKFKVWVRHAQYDKDDLSQFAGQSFKLEIRNPRNEKVLDKQFKADEYGGFDGELELPKGTTLGQYRMVIPSHGGGGHFRVEEYKKPEFEVSVEAPKEPVMLGEKITAKIKAKYYFGAPVVSAKVKYKILRSSHSANWFPEARWDWFYGPGYWWYASDYDWYPGWGQWGCRAPTPWWWNRRSPPPELVLQREVDIGPDGVVEVEIDTALAKALHGDLDHRYELTAEVVDESRRTIVGNGRVLVARRPFQVYVWVDRGHYNVKDTIQASFSARTLDNQPVKGKGNVELLKISYDKEGEPQERRVRSWPLDTDDEGRASLKLSASQPGQYRLSYKVADAEGHEIEGGYIFVVRGQGFDGADFRFSKIEVVPDKREYKPGEKIEVMVNTDRAGATVLLFVRPANGVYLAPRVIHMEGKSTVEEILVARKDMPNFFIEALTVFDANVHTAMREIVVPPEKRVLNVKVVPSAAKYKPGEKASVKVQLTDSHEEPYVGSLVLTMYDKSVEYISGGANVPEIKSYFWKWRRRHNPQTRTNLTRHLQILLKKGELDMGFLGAFGHSVADRDREGFGGGGNLRTEYRKAKGRGGMMPQSAVASPSAPMARRAMAKGAIAEMSMDAVAGDRMNRNSDKALNANGIAAPGQVVQPTVRTKFADTAYWAAALETDKRGYASIELDMPENLTGWKIKTWAMGHGTRVGEGVAEVVTTKDLLLRLQAPRFFVEKDEVVLSANVHNYLETAKTVKVVLDLNECLESIDALEQTVHIDATGEKRVDWRVKVVREGKALVRMKALTDEESDAMEMHFPAKVHGIDKMVAFSGHIRQDADRASITLDVPAERRIDQTALEVRYSPTLAGAMVDALPYLVDYPYGCTEQTLNRFLPTVITQKVLLDMGLDLADIRDKQTNLNAQELGDDAKRAEQWKRAKGKPRKKFGEEEYVWNPNPVFDVDQVRDMVGSGVRKLTEMQLTDGGWGWFSGHGERSYPHTTAYVVHGLQTARYNDAAVPANAIARGIQWLTRYQQEQVTRLKNAPSKTKPWKTQADNLDAFIFMVLTDEKKTDKDMLGFLYRDRNHLAVYSKAMFGMALHQVGEKEKVAMIMRNIDQFLVKDEENQTAYLKLGNGGYWWYWYGSEWEAQAYYLKLLARVEPKGWRAPYLVKYLLNNRRHATYWNSTRDTAICIEAFADYMRASGEDKPDLTIEILVDGKKHKDVKINAANLFSFDNKLVLAGAELTSGKHTVEFRKAGKGPLYFNAYLSYFSLEDFIPKAGLELKVERKYYKLVAVDKKVKVAGARGQALDQRVEKYRREPLRNLAAVISGDLIEVEMLITSKNDYEYIVFEDLKAAGFEPFDVRSGYSRDGMRAYMELRDDRVSFFVQRLARGQHSMAYKVRAEIPGRFSALPTKAYAMYAPELKANSDEFKIRIQDRPKPKDMVELPK